MSARRWRSILIIWAILAVMALVWEGPLQALNLFPNSPSAHGFGEFIFSVFSSDIITTGGDTDTGVGGQVQTGFQLGNFTTGFIKSLGQLVILDFGYFNLNVLTEIAQWIAWTILFAPTVIVLVQYLISLIWNAVSSLASRF